MSARMLNLGAWRRVDGSPGGEKLRLPPAHLTTHAVVVGMTGSGKTGLVTVLVEEALSAGIPALIIDVKGDLPNLMLSFPDCSPEQFSPWLESSSATAQAEQATALAQQRQRAFAEWSISPERLRTFCGETAVASSRRGRARASYYTCSRRSNGARPAGTVIRNRRAQH